MISTIAINGLTMGTVASGYLLGRLSGFEYPEINVEVKNRGGYHGGELGQYNYRARHMTIEGKIYAQDLSDYNTKRIALMQAFFLHGGLATATITLKNAVTLQADVIVSGQAPSAPYKQGDAIYSDFAIEVTAPYPMLLGTVEQSQELIPSNLGGFAIPFELPLDMSEGGDDGVEVVANNGNGIAWPEVTIEGIIENPVVTNVTSGLQLQLQRTLTNATDSVVINFYRRTAVLNGSTNVRYQCVGDFWVLAPGNNSLQLTTASHGESGKATVRWRHSYLGV